MFWIIISRTHGGDLFKGAFSNQDHNFQFCVSLLHPRQMFPVGLSTSVSLFEVPSLQTLDDATEQVADEVRIAGPLRLARLELLDRNH